MRRKGRAAYRALLWLLLAALLSVAVFAGARLWRIARDSARADRLLWEMRRTALVSASSVPAREPSGPPPAADASAQDAPSQEMPAQENGADSPAPSHRCPVDFGALRAQYPDVVAWLTGCGGAIDTPIVQGADNQYYLDHLPDGTQNRLGAAFLDSENNPAFSDDQSFLFGHHMDAGGGVFSPLLEYRDAAYGRAHPAFALHTPEGCWSAEVFAAFVIEERAYPYQRDFSSAQAMQSFLTEVCARSEFSPPVRPAPGDRVLTLCTCTSKTSDLRYVVCARLTPLTDEE